MPISMSSVRLVRGNLVCINSASLKPSIVTALSLSLILNSNFVWDIQERSKLLSLQPCQSKWLKTHQDGSDTRERRICHLL